MGSNFDGEMFFCIHCGVVLHTFCGGWGPECDMRSHIIDSRFRSANDDGAAADVCVPTVNVWSGEGAERWPAEMRCCFDQAVTTDGSSIQTLSRVYILRPYDTIIIGHI
jgi:hypothetical protein